MPSCKDCMHWVEGRKGNMKRTGQCRRHAPKPDTSGGAVIETQWPITLEDDSCAEFATAAPAKAATAKQSAGEDAAPKRTPRKTSKGGAARTTR